MFEPQKWFFLDLRKEIGLNLVGLALSVTLYSCKGIGLLGRQNSNLDSADRLVGAIEQPEKASICKRNISLVEVEKLASFNLTYDQLASIFTAFAALRDPKDPVTGFATGLDRLPALARASAKVKASRATIFYVEVDVRNLGGLNLELKTHAAANELFRSMAQTVFDSLGALTDKPTENLCAFRHGGDEFSFILEPGRKNADLQRPDLLQAEVERQLAAAQAQIADKIKSWGLEKRDLSNIIHPKNCLSEELMNALVLSAQQRKQAEKLCAPFRGTGIYYGVSQVLSSAQELSNKKELECWLGEKVIKVADAAMSAQKHNAQDTSQSNTLPEPGDLGPAGVRIQPACDALSLQ